MKKRSLRLFALSSLTLAQYATAFEQGDQLGKFNISMLLT